MVQVWSGTLLGRFVKAVRMVQGNFFYLLGGLQVVGFHEGGR